MKRALILAAAVVLQASVSRFFVKEGAVLDFALPALLLYIFADGGFGKAWPLALAAGMVLDTLSGAAFGVFILGYGAAAVLSSALLFFMPRDRLLHFALLAAWGGFWFFAFVSLYLALLSGGAFPFTLAGAAVSVAYTVFLAILLYPLKKWIRSAGFEQNQFRS